MLVAPSAHTIDPSTGALAAHTGRYQKHLSDLRGLYADEDAFERALNDQGDRVVYTVEDVRPQANSGDLIFGTTFMEPGQIGEEFFMTRGHIHATANRPETYYGESGEGLMLMESPDGQISILEVRPKVMVYVPPLWIHRSVNTGDEPLVMSFCYPADSGQDYEVIAKSGGMAVRIIAEGDGWARVPNASYRPRTQAEIDAILATQDFGGRDQS
ncbi:MAG: glucose-6-phosphate isomerase [Hyphomicrobiales bacterium]